MKRVLLLCALAAFVLTACNSDFDRTALSESLRIDNGKPNERGILNALNQKPLARRPFKLAVVFPGSNLWNSQEKENVMKALDKLKGNGDATDIVAIPDSMLPAGDFSLLEKARYAAAKHQADVVMIVKEAQQRNQYVNGLAFFDITIACAFLLPGSHCDALVMLECSFWDVRNGCFLGSVTAEGQASSVRPTFLMDSAKTVREARDKAVSDAAVQIENRAPVFFRDLKQGPQLPAVEPEEPLAQPAKEIRT